jgi:hypothetical protein
MLDWLTHAKLPIGLLMFAGMFLALVARRVRARRASRDFPELAARLGLRHRPPTRGRGIGTLSGDYAGYHVHIDPDDQRRLTVRFETSPDVDLRNYEIPRGSPPQMRTYYSGDRKFDAFFKTRYACEQVAARLAKVKNPRKLVESFRGTYYRELKQVNVTHHGVSCVLDFGNPPHLPVDAIEYLLPAMVALARVIEPHEETGPYNPSHSS